MAYRFIIYNRNTGYLH